MRRLLIQKYTIKLVILLIGCSNLFAQWTTPVSTHVYTSDRVDIGQDLRNTDRQVNIYGSKTYGYQVGSYIVSEFPSNPASFIGKATARIADASSYYANGMGIGILAYTSDVTRIRSSGSMTAYVGGGSFGAVITDPIPSGYESQGSYLIFGVRAYLNGSISRYPTNGVVTALYAKDHIKGTKTWAGYFDGKVAVDGEIVAEEVEVVSQVPWPDFVFNNEYELKTLPELESYICDNNHLPGVPTSDEIKEKGLNLGEMNAKLLQKLKSLRFI